MVVFAILDGVFGMFDIIFCISEGVPGIAMHIHSINFASISDRDEAKQNRLDKILLNQVLVYLVFWMV